MATTLDPMEVLPPATERVSASEFLRIMQDTPDAVAGARVIPPQLGEPGFGHIVVSWKAGGSYFIRKTGRLQGR